MQTEQRTALLPFFCRLRAVSDGYQLDVDLRNDWKFLLVVPV